MKLLKLENAKGLDIKQGSLAVELPWGMYADKLTKLIERTGKNAQEFVCVEWIEGGEPGYYLGARFTVVQDVPQV